MGPVFWIFRQYFLRDFRNRFTIFWTLVFPVLLMSIMILIFGNLGEGTGINIRAGIVDEDLGTFSQIVVDVFQEIAAEEESWLELSAVEKEGLDAELAKLRQGERHAVLHLKKGFTEDIYLGVMEQRILPGEVSVQAKVAIYGKSQSQSSEIAVSALTQVLQAINREISIRSDLIARDELVDLSFAYVEVGEETGQPFSYVDYIVPGIMLMAFLSTGISAVVEGITSLRDRGILKRYFATPISTFQYSSGLVLYNLCLALLQVLLIYSFGRFVFGTEINPFKLEPLMYLIYSIIVLMGFGLFMAAISRTANAANSLINIVFYPMMFLGGLFFPLTELPLFLQIITAVNPVTYLINGLRDSLGVFVSPTSAFLNIMVPMVWLLFCIYIGVRRFRWD